MVTTFLEIPAFRDAHYEYDILLDGIRYTVVMMWNEALQRWVMRLKDADGAYIFASRTVVLGENIFRGPDTRLPRGFTVLAAADDTQQHREPDFETLGEGVSLQYVQTL